MKRLYRQCCGHWFTGGAYCPRDGYGAADTRQLQDCIERITKGGGELSLSSLRSAGATDEMLRSVIIVEFESPTVVADFNQRLVEDYNRIVDPGPREHPLAWIGRLLTRHR